MPPKKHAKSHNIDHFPTSGRKWGPAETDPHETFGDKTPRV